MQILDYMGSSELLSPSFNHYQSKVGNECSHRVALSSNFVIGG